MTPYDRDEEQDMSAPADPAARDAGATGPESKEQDAVEALRAERNALQDRLLRTAAEFDNYRKRIDRERRDQADAATADALEDLLPIMDNLDLALSAPGGDDADAYRKGVELIHRQMGDLLRKRGVKAIEAVGTDFDPRFHQAVVQEVSPDHREGEVMQELRRGYMLGDRLLRAAMVKVAKA
jgi:molecular chaperone GrpE